jgi:hypothetical protein
MRNGRERRPSQFLGTQLCALVLHLVSVPLPVRPDWASVMMYHLKTAIQVGLLRDLLATVPQAMRLAVQMQVTNAVPVLVTWSSL